MITKEIAISLNRGQTLYHKSIKGSDGLPIRCRVSGKCQVWKTRPDEFKIPVKHGLYTNFYITQFNAEEWSSK